MERFVIRKRKSDGVVVATSKNFEDVEPEESRSVSASQKGHRGFGQTEHNLGKSTFEYFSRQCYEIFDAAAVKLQSRFDPSNPGLKA